MVRYVETGSRREDVGEEEESLKGGSNGYITLVTQFEAYNT